MSRTRWAFPVLGSDGKYSWPDVAIRPSDKGGKDSGAQGLFARHALPKNTVIPVFGFVLARADLDHNPNLKIWERVDPTIASYSFQTKGIRGEERILVLHPWFSQNGFIDDRLLATGYANEPSAGEHVNAVYQKVLRRNRAYGFLRTIRAVPADTEILWHYGTEYLRSNYAVGEPVEPPADLIDWKPPQMALYDAIRDGVIEPVSDRAVKAFKKYLISLGQARPPPPPHWRHVVRRKNAPVEPSIRRMNQRWAQERLTESSDASGYTLNGRPVRLSANTIRRVMHLLLKRVSTRFSDQDKEEKEDEAALSIRLSSSGLVVIENVLRQLVEDLTSRTMIFVQAKVPRRKTLDRSSLLAALGMREVLDRQGRLVRVVRSNCTWSSAELRPEVRDPFPKCTSGAARDHLWPPACALLPKTWFEGVIRGAVDSHSAIGARWRVGKTFIYELQAVVERQLVAATTNLVQMAYATQQKTIHADLLAVAFSNILPKRFNIAFQFNQLPRLLPLP